MKVIHKFFRILFVGVGVALVIVTTSAASSTDTHPEKNRAESPKTGCEPTPSDYLGPFYKANAPARSSVGKGYQLRGKVISSTDCSTIPNATIELWLTGPDGSYDDDHRATILSDEAGRYRFESNFPPGYSGRPPHIHIRISAPGFKTLATQHYPAAGQNVGNFDIVLISTEY